MASVIDAATQEERPSMLVGWRRDVTTRRSRSDEKRGAMARLSGRSRDRAAARDALVRGKMGAVLDRFCQQIKGVLCMGLDQLDLRKGVLVGLDVVAVLHFIEAVCGVQIFVVALLPMPLLISSRQSGGHGTRTG